MTSQRATDSNRELREYSGEGTVWKYPPHRNV